MLSADADAVAPAAGSGAAAFGGTGGSTGGLSTFTDIDICLAFPATSGPASSKVEASVDAGTAPAAGDFEDAEDTEAACVPEVLHTEPVATGEVLVAGAAVTGTDSFTETLDAARWAALGDRIGGINSPVKSSPVMNG